jgi:bifunctional non-homologous end joining protein LigD
VPKGIEPSNQHKVFWPEAGITKGDLLEYFDLIAPCILPTLRDRPLTVKRYPDGVSGGAFFQKNTPAYAPAWVKTITLRAESAGRDVRYTVANSKRTLLWLGNQAAIELHPWLSRTDRLEQPDALVIDLDPPEGAFDRAVEAAFLVRDTLAELGLEAAAKTSGSKGVHVYVPLQRRYGFGQVREAAGRLAARVQERDPGLSTIEVRRAGREGRVFLDSGRNSMGAHVVAPYSPRARPAASVSFPVPWEDLSKVQPEDFTVRTAPKLLAERGDLWRELMPPNQRLPRDLLDD